MGEVRSLELRYTKRALRQLAAILDYLDQRSPAGAKNVQLRIRQMIELLRNHPEIGAPTQRAGFRRLVINLYPYVVLYQTRGEVITIHSVRHAARRASSG